MGFRFRKSVKLLPGLKVNLSKSGASLTVGKAGACVNVSAKGTRATVGLPGTGLSYSTRLGKKSSSRPAPVEDAALQAVPVVRKPVSLWGKLGIWCLWAMAFFPVTQKGDAYGALSLVGSIALTVLTVKWINRRRAKSNARLISPHS